MFAKLSDFKIYFVFLLSGAGLLFLAGCNVNVAGKERPFLIHSPIKGELELVVESLTDEQGNGQTKTKNKTKVFEERLKLQTSGNIYHPNLLLYDVAVGIGLTQQKFSSNTESSSENGEFNEYDILLQLLSTKLYPVTVHLDRFEELLPRQFVGSLKSERESFSILMPLRLENWPMLFQYNTSSVDQKSVGSAINDFYTRDDEQFRYSVEHDFSEYSHMRFEFS